MENLTRHVLHHRRLVAIGWLVLTIVGVMASGPATEALDQRFSVPGREGWDVSVEIQEKFGTGGEALPFIPVATMPNGADAAKADLLALEEAAKQAVPGARVAGYGSTGDKGFLSDDGKTAFVYVFPARADNPFGANVDAVRSLEKKVEATKVDGQPVRLTGFDALFDSTGEAAEGPGVLIEAVIGGVGALLVLVFVFGSFLAVVPLVMAICSIMVSLLLLLGLTQLTELSPVLQFLVPLIGLGISIDYALIVVVRWREEREKGLENDEAIVQAMKTAGRAVVFSGTTVAIGLLALVALPLPFLRSMGYGGLLIPLVATVTAITLLPVVLSKMGPKLDKKRIKRSDRSFRFWTGWSEWIVRRRGLAALIAVALLALLIYPVTNLHMGQSDPDTIATAGPAKDALKQLRDSGIGSGVIAPTETLVPVEGAEAVRAAQAEVKGVHGAVAPDAPEWRRDGLAIVTSAPLSGDENQAGRDAVQGQIRAAHAAHPEARVGGSGPLNADFIDAVYGSFPLMIALISLVTFLLLARAFRSIVLPAKAIVLNVLSVAAAWGVMTWIWQNGNGSDEIWGVAATGSISSWIPLMVFAFLYGLSMDYEVFILARVREEYDITGDTNEAVVYGLSRTGRLVTSAALILFLTFAAMASGPGADIKTLATGLAAGILIDATVIRALLVPALVTMFGKWNWWLPDWFAKLLRVPPSHLQAEPARA
jgi:RND superfamily putative drug exporter